MTPMSNDPAEARKRRKEIIQSQRSENELVANVAAALASSGAATASSTVNGASAKIAIIGAGTEEGTNTTTINDGGDGSEKKPPKKRKVATGDSASRKKNVSGADETGKTKKTQIRYDPDVPMSKDQLAAWRREARRVRNRESAAASRQRIRNRISELEDEVGEWKAKYTQALQRLEALENCISANAAGVGQQQQQQEQQQESLQQIQDPQVQPKTEPTATASVPGNQADGEIVL